MSNEPHRQKCYVFGKDKAEGVIRLAMKKSIRSWVDEMECSKSFRRTTCLTKTVDDVLKMSLKSPAYVHWTFIRREDSGCPIYWEIGCITCDGSDRRIEYFIWIHVTDEDGESIAKEYELKEHI